jgi:hypothetical protein
MKDFFNSKLSSQAKMNKTILRKSPSSSLAVDLDMVESTRRLEHPPWIRDNMENVNTQMTAIPKMTATARIKTEMEQAIEEDVRMFTDGSLMEDRVGCEAREIKIRLPKQMSIFNAEAVAILEAITATRRWGIAKKIILTYSLSNLIAQEKIYTRRNSKTY